MPIETSFANVGNNSVKIHLTGFDANEQVSGILDIRKHTNFMPSDAVISAWRIEGDIIGIRVHLQTSPNGVDNWKTVLECERSDGTLYDAQNISALYYRLYVEIIGEGNTLGVLLILKNGV
jgi:hypothetical protein